MTTPTLPGPLARYEDVVEDWPAFVSATTSPEPTTFRVRRALLSASDLASRLREQGFETSQVSGLTDYLRVVDGPGSVAQTLEHWLGFLHVQQAVMALPPLALAPRPGERILDLCAAPGGKTTHLSELMNERGALLAVDPKEKRLRGLMANVFRLGYTNVITIAADGRELPDTALFDRVLVDAPCSAEGNLRRQGGKGGKHPADFRRYVSRLQESLLRQAIRLTRPGGVVVYSTCTFAPEENEAVVHRVLADSPVEIEPIPLDLPHSPGLSSWQGHSFAPAITQTWRVYPHHLDSGGLFMARLRRKGEATPTGDGPRPDWELIPPGFPGEADRAARERIEGASDVLEEEYGFASEVLEGLSWMVRKENIWVHTAGEWPYPGWQDRGGWRVVSAGLRAFRAARGGKETPSNQFLGRFQRALGDGRRLDLDAASLQELLEDRPLPAGDRLGGPLALFFRDTLIGRGMVGRSGLRHEIPAAQAARLRAILRRPDHPREEERT